MSFEAVTLSREDLEAIGFSSDVNDKVMQKIASKLGDRLVEFGGYWDILQAVCEMYDIPKIKTEEN